MLLDPRRGSRLVRRGKAGPRREVGMDDWASEQLSPWLTGPVGPLFLSSTARRADDVVGRRGPAPPPASVR
jgi:hypothetical protein